MIKTDLSFFPLVYSKETDFSSFWSVFLQPCCNKKNLGSLSANCAGAGLNALQGGQPSLSIFLGVSRGDGDPHPRGKRRSGPPRGTSVSPGPYLPGCARIGLQPSPGAGASARPRCPNPLPPATVPPMAHTHTRRSGTPAPHRDAEPDLPLPSSPFLRPPIASCPRCSVSPRPALGLRAATPPPGQRELPRAPARAPPDAAEAAAGGWPGRRLPAACACAAPPAAAPR